MITSKLFYPFFLMASFSIGPLYATQISDATSCVESESNNIDYLNQFEKQENDAMDDYIFMETPIEHAEDEFVPITEKIYVPGSKESSKGIKILNRISMIKKAIKDVDHRIEKESKKNCKIHSSTYKNLNKTRHTLIDEKNKLLKEYEGLYDALCERIKNQYEIKRLNKLADQVLSKEEQRAKPVRTSIQGAACIVVAETIILGIKCANFFGIE